MNTENLNTWLAALRSGEYGQATGTLVEAEVANRTYNEDCSEVIEYTGRTLYCCLGVGPKVSGVDPQACVVEANRGLPTAGFVKWLDVGIDETDTALLSKNRLYKAREDFAADQGEWDLILDIPRHLLTQGDPAKVRHRQEHGLTNRSTVGTVTAANLNDSWHLTFPQIADMIEYFGIRGVR